MKSSSSFFLSLEKKTCKKFVTPSLTSLTHIFLAVPFSSFLAKSASEQRVIAAGVAFFLTYSLLKRTNVAFFPDGALAFAPDFAAVYGYSAPDVLAVDVNPVILAGLTVVNVVSILTFGFLESSILSWAVEPFGAAALTINQLPIVNALQHVVEAILFSAAIFTGNVDFAAFAGLLSQMRSIIALASLLLSAIASLQFLRVWFTVIGRDGRQKIEKKEE